MVRQHFILGRQICRRLVRSLAFRWKLGLENQLFPVTNKILLFMSPFLISSTPGIFAHFHPLQLTHPGCTFPLPLDPLSHLFSYSAFHDAYAGVCWSSLAIGSLKGLLIWNICWFLWCKFCHMAVGKLPTWHPPAGKILENVTISSQEPVWAGASAPQILWDSFVLWVKPSFPTSALRKKTFPW